MFFQKLAKVSLLTFLENHVTNVLSLNNLKGGLQLCHSSSLETMLPQQPPPTPHSPFTEISNRVTVLGLVGGVGGGVSAGE